MALRPEQCLVSLEARRRQFLFFADSSNDQIVYYQLPAGDASANFRLMGRVTIPGESPIRSSSSWFAGTVYSDSEVWTQHTLLASPSFDVGDALVRLELTQRCLIF